MYQNTICSFETFDRRVFLSPEILQEMNDTKFKKFLQIQKQHLIRKLEI